MSTSDPDTAAVASAHVDQARNVPTHDANTATLHPHQGNKLGVSTPQLPTVGAVTTGLLQDTGAMPVITSLSEGLPSHREAAPGGVAVVSSSPSPSAWAVSDPTHREDTRTSSASGLLASSGMIQSVPYLSIVTGALLQILKMREEVKYNRDEWNEIMKDIAAIAGIIDGHMKEENVRGILLSKSVQDHLCQLVKILEDVQKQLSKCCDKGKSATLLNILQRRKVKSLLDICQTQVHMELEFFNLRANLSNNADIHRLDDQVQVLEQYGESTSMIRIKYTLPTKPGIMHGHDDIIAKLVTAILNGPSSRIALLGPRGIGKTSIALSVLHHHDIQRSYKCYFLACDAIDSRDALIISIGKGVFANKEHSLNEARILNAVRNLGIAILCLDNFDIPWKAQKTEVEAFLSKLAAINSIHLLITMREKELPQGTSWKKNFITNSAKYYVEEAPQLHQQGQNVVDQANNLRNLGELNMRLNNLDSAKHHLEGALQLHQQVQSILDQAYDLQNLGELDMRLDDLDSAKHHFEQALQLHQQAQDVVGQANDLVYLGALNMRLNDLDSAKHHFEEALQLHQQAHNVLGQAYDLAYLGKLNIRLNDLDLANLHFQEALQLDQQAQSVFGQAYDLQNLGELDMRLNDLDSAKHHFEEALQLHQQAQNVLGQANNLRNLGELNMRLNNLDLAKHHLKRALQLHQQVQSILGQANDLQNLGELDMRLDDLDSAKHHFEQALQLHQQVQSILGQAYDLQNLGQLNMRLDDFDSAKHHFEEALQLHQQAQDVVGQANGLAYLGALDMRLNDLDSAKQHFKKALQLHQQAQDALGQANDLTYLGTLDMRLDDLVSAKQYFEKAVQLYQTSAFHGHGEAYQAWALLEKVKAQLKQRLNSY